MRQKFAISRAGRKELALKEFSELEKNEYTMVYKTTYDLSKVSKAFGEGTEALGVALRSEVFFPPEPILEQVMHAVIELLTGEDMDTVEVFIDDNNVADIDNTEIDMDDESGDEDLDDILEDDDDDLVSDADE